MEPLWNLSEIKTWTAADSDPAQGPDGNVRCNIFTDHRTLMLVGGIFSRLDHINETQADTDRSKRAYLSKSFHHTRQRPSKVTVSDGQFGIGAPKRKFVHYIHLGVCRRNQEDKVFRAVLLDTA
jgi:hypothetical protein